ncbi:hypothetical protein [Desulfonatronum thioautotrophicum]|uniref:hypothetical protein n=1 Tax=Desulfonatronum thioautotrophicum TaxID=617001 RepID=UPI000699ED9F|nr:hypothetical protein [Desulfonatronum thioautotrophicum]
MKISKSDLYDRLELGIWNRLPEGIYEVQWSSPRELIKWNRLDIGMRTLYLELKDKTPELADKIYFEDLRAQTLGTLVDPDNLKKSDFNIFKKVFDEVSDEIRSKGFDADKTLLPVSNTGSILNGAHRLSAALIHDKDVAFIQTTLPPITCDHQYFFDRAVPIKIIEQSVIQFLGYARNCFVAFLWPSGSSNVDKTEKLFENVVYKKKICLTNKGAINLLYQCYHHMDWVGDEASSYRGLHQKLFECFPTSDGLIMIIFQAEDGIEQVRAIKEKIRFINGLGYSSIHITDTQEEALRLASLLCNENGLHYLNHADLLKNKHQNILDHILDLSKYKNIQTNDFIIDGSWLLELYGLRESKDVDILAATGRDDISRSLNFDSRVKEIQYHGKPANELIYNPDNHFFLFEVKLIGFEQLKSMKKKRGEAKDLLDVKLMSRFMENKRKRFEMLRIHLAQRWLYARIQARKNMFNFIGKILRSLGLYQSIREVYHLIINRKKHTDG